MTPLNIVIVNRLMGIKFGGGENFDLNIAQHLTRMGHKVTIVTGRPLFKASTFSPQGLNVKFVRTPYLRWLHYKFMDATFKPLKVLGLIGIVMDRWIFRWTMRFCLRRLVDADVYQLTGFPQLGAWLTSIGKLTVVRWPGPPAKSLLPSMKKCNINIANGNAYQKIKADLYSDIHFVNVGIDYHRFYQDLTVKKASDTVNFLFVGRIVPIKNIPYLLDGFRAAYDVNKSIRLTIVGSGHRSELAKVTAFISDNGLEDVIHVLPAQSGAQLVACYHRADCFALTSSYDNYPNVVLEAMAAGLPIVGTKVGGIVDQVTQNKGGFLVELDHVTQLKQALLDVADSFERRVEMGRFNQRWVYDRHSWETTSKELEGLYYSLVGQ